MERFQNDREKHKEGEKKRKAFFLKAKFAGDNFISKVNNTKARVPAPPLPSNRVFHSRSSRLWQSVFLLR